MYASMRACFASQDPSELFPGTFPGDSYVGGTGNERCSSRNRGPTSIQRSDSQAAHGRTTSGSGHVVGRSFEPLADGVAGKANTPALAGRGVGLRYHEDRFGLFAQLNSDSAIPGGWRQRLTRRSRSFFGRGSHDPARSATAGRPTPRTGCTPRYSCLFARPGPPSVPTTRSSHPRPKRARGVLNKSDGNKIISTSRHPRGRSRFALKRSSEVPESGEASSSPPCRGAEEA